MRTPTQSQVITVALLLALAGIALTAADGLLTGWHWTHTATVPLLGLCTLMIARAVWRLRRLGR